MTTGLEGLLIPIVSIVLGIFMIIVAIVTKHRRDMHQLELQHRERMAAIEKGLELPPEHTVAPPAILGTGAGRGGARYLLRGLIWSGVGLALALSEGTWADRMHSYGWIAAAVGVAYLIYYALEGRKNDYPRQRGAPGPGGPPPP